MRTRRCWGFIKPVSTPRVRVMMPESTIREVICRNVKEDYVSYVRPCNQTVCTIVLQVLMVQPTYYSTSGTMVQTAFYWRPASLTADAEKPDVETNIVDCEQDNNNQCADCKSGLGD